MPAAPQQTAEAPSAEIGQVDNVTVVGNVIPDNTHASPETIGRAASTEDMWRVQRSSSRKTQSSAAVASDLPGLTNQQWKEEVREACAYIKDFLARYKPVVTTPQE